MIQPMPDKDWFDSRRFVIAQPKHHENGWGVRDLKTNVLLIADVSMEESGLYADTCEQRYNCISDEHKP